MSGSLERLEEGALLRLQSERQEWHADLDSLLEGNFAREDLELAISLARCGTSCAARCSNTKFGACA
jgi:hypothetical protein